MVPVVISLFAIAISVVTVYYSVKTNKIMRRWFRLNDLSNRGVRIDENGNEVQL